MRVFDFDLFLHSEDSPRVNVPNTREGILNGGGGEVSHARASLTFGSFLGCLIITDYHLSLTERGVSR